MTTAAFANVQLPLATLVYSPTVGMPPPNDVFGCSWISTDGSAMPPYTARHRRQLTYEHSYAEHTALSGLTRRLRAYSQAHLHACTCDVQERAYERDHVDDSKALNNNNMLTAGIQSHSTNACDTDGRSVAQQAVFT
jgi:hypothetical protein